jgi:protein SCO1/2
MRNRRRLVTIAIVGLIALAIPAAVLAFWPPLQQTPSIGGAFVLTNQDGKRVTEKDLLGKPSAIFFGFTRCPDVCPATLLEMTNWLQTLGDEADKINAVFVSVDSEGDTPESMKLYLSSFDPHIRGFTGTAEQIKGITAAYRVYYKRVALDGGGYTYDHSATVYLMDKNGRYIGLVTYKEPDASAIAKLRALIAGKRDQFDPTNGRAATAANR